jgi:hypothetical protein
MPRISQQERFERVVSGQVTAEVLTSNQGVRFSVAAGAGVSCLPHSDSPPYWAVEVLVLDRALIEVLESELPSVHFDDYGVAGYVLVESIRAVLEE